MNGKCCEITSVRPNHRDVRTFSIEGVLVSANQVHDMGMSNVKKKRSHEDK